MIENPENKLDTTRPQQRRGFSYQNHATLFNVKDKITLKDTLVMRNRPSLITDSENVFEVYFDKDPGERENYIFIGRGGVIDPTTKNTSYIELSANCDTKKGLSTDKVKRNGRILITLDHDKKGNDIPNLMVQDSGSLGFPTGSVVSAVVGRGDYGVSGIGYDNVSDPFNPTVELSLYNYQRSLFLGKTLEMDTDAVYDIGTTGTRLRTIYLINSPDVSSDIRLKNDVKPLEYGLDEVLKINPISYERGGKKHLGFSAQELREIVPEMVLEADGTRGENELGLLSIHPDYLIPVLLNAIKTLSARVDVLTSGDSAVSNDESQREND